MPLLAIGFFNGGRPGAWGVFERRRERERRVSFVRVRGGEGDGEKEI
jgi:hypothetical protein